MTSERVLVIDTETTGLDGAPKDVVVDIGICEVDLDEGKVYDMYSSVVGHDISEWNEYRRNAWIFENTDMTLEMVDEATPFEIVRKDVESILRGRKVTAFNTDYDMRKFLYLSPWSLKDKFVECTDIMKAATSVCKIPSPYYGRRYTYPKLDRAYEMIVEGDPAELHGKQDHRALSDARVASYVMIGMFRNGEYRPDPVDRSSPSLF